MKKIAIVLMSAFLFSAYTYAQTTQADKTKEEVVVDKPVIKFDKTTHDYGRIAEEVGQAICEFEFTNTGDKPLIINRVAASCGCTTPDYTKEPVLPGKKGKITVSYSTVNRPGSFSKTVRVFSNSQSSPDVLVIKGEVLPKGK